jgi:ATP-dependent RNA helicase DHX36
LLLSRGLKQHLLKLKRNNQEIGPYASSRLKLPAVQQSDLVNDTVARNPVSVVIGATGSGKTTQVPQIILDWAIKEGRGGRCFIICSQPRRIAAMASAKRVAAERGEEPGRSVGYAVRFDRVDPRPAGSILFCTNGMLLNFLLLNPDLVLGNTSHIILDEAHERDVELDAILIILKKLGSENFAKKGTTFPKIVVMSATVHANHFTSYFAHQGLVQTPTITFPGRLFTVAEHYLDDLLAILDRQYGNYAKRHIFNDLDSVRFLAAESAFTEQALRSQGYAAIDSYDDTSVQQNEDEITPEEQDDETMSLEEAEAEEAESAEKDIPTPIGLIATTIAHICKSTSSGAVLVFLPGVAEITKVDKYLRKEQPLGLDSRDEKHFSIFHLHSRSRDDQTRVFEQMPPQCRKIILATNIAETSITIPDVKYVVDSGFRRQRDHDQGLATMSTGWISKSSSTQRKGRAGRVSNGHYFALFSRTRANSLIPEQVPRILCTDLQSTVLQLLNSNLTIPVREFFASAIEPPEPAAVEDALRELTALGALDGQEQVTPLGRLLFKIPMHPSSAKMVILGIIFRCLDPMMILAIQRETQKPLFQKHPGIASIKNDLADGSASDHIALVNAFKGLRAAQAAGFGNATSFCMENKLSMQTFSELTRLVRHTEQALAREGFIDSLRFEQHMWLSDRTIGDAAVNANSDNHEVIRAALTAALSSNIAMPRYQGKETVSMSSFGTLIGSGSYAPVSNKSVNFRQRLLGAMPLVYSQLFKYRAASPFLDETTLVSPLILSLFAGSQAAATADGVTDDGLVADIVLDDTVRVLVDAPENEGGHPSAFDTTTRDLVVKLRSALAGLLKTAYVDLGERKNLAADPAYDILAKDLPALLERYPSVQGQTHRPT